MSGEVKKVSMAVIKRLPTYLQCLGRLLRDNTERVSSQELSRILGFTASQIRQDLNNFGEFGQQGYGYNVEQLYNEIAKILGLNTTHRMIVIGAGNLGQALANYGGFANHGFKIVALFDNNPELVGKNYNGLPIFDVNDVDYFVNQNDIDIAILTVPYTETLEIAETLWKTSVRGLWNFTPVKLTAPPNKVVENVSLTESLFTLSYHINEERLQERMLKRKASQNARKNLPNMVK